MWFQKRIAGVTFDNRQAVIATLNPWEELQLVRDYDNPYDANAIRVERVSTGEQLGFLDRATAANLARRLDDLGGAWSAQIVRICHNGTEDSILGVEIGFDLPERAVEVVGA